MERLRLGTGSDSPPGVKRPVGQNGRTQKEANSMAARPASDDPRSLRSREQILAALHETARAGTLTSISALSTAAGVTRATFYNHFDTIEQAAWTAISESFDELLE